MCGILFVHSKNAVPIEQHQTALSVLSRRGPDYLRYKSFKNTFIAQTVLHVTGSNEFYNRHANDFFAYNGEIYNYHRFRNHKSDVDLAYEAARDNPERFRHFEGAWAWCYFKDNEYRYASDPQGERCLYRYQDSEILIVASEVAAILQYKNLGLDIKPYTERHWPVRHATPWQGIERLTPGVMYDHNNRATKIDSVFDWAAPVAYSRIEEAEEDFTSLFHSVVQDMRPKEPFGITFSGGLDSACILSELPDAAHLYTINNDGKDTVSNNVAKFLTEEQQHRLIQIDVDQEIWARDFCQVVNTTRMPVQSWSFVGQWQIARACSERILFSGVGADELFGGYAIYSRLKYNTDHSASPYSCFNPTTANTDVVSDWHQCLNFYNGDPAQATLLMDYLTQVAAVDMRGVDVCTSTQGIEPRSPFTHPSVIKFALNLPFEYKVGTTPKPIIRQRFLRNWSQDLVYPKQGFSGQCNDSYEYLDININRLLDRDADWKNITQAGFVKHCGIQTNPLSGRTIQV